MEQQFQHIPLAEPSREIRLLNLEPARHDDDEIRCTLFVYRFEPRWINIGTGDAGFNYNAISYAWGNLTRSHHIWVNEKSLSVTENCHYALWQARKHHARYAGPVWIDAICINQDDDEEKSKQVAMMASIYACSSHTLVSFGTHENDSELFCAHVASIGPKRLDVDLDSRGCEVLGCESDLFLESCLSFYKRPYWERLWIVQELIFTKTGACMCGEDTFDLDILRLVVTHHGINEHPHPRFYALGTNFIPITKIFDYRETIKKGDSRIPSLLELMFSFSLQHCSDPRDRVFSLNGLQSPSQRLEPDYSMSRFELAEQVLAAAEISGTLKVPAQKDLLETIVRALEIDFSDPDIRRLSAERLLSCSEIDSPSRPSPARSDIVPRPELTVKYQLDLHKNVDGKFACPYPASFGLGKYEYEDFPDCTEPLLCGSRCIGRLPQNAREGDILALYWWPLFQQPPSQLPVQVHVLLVLRRYAEAVTDPEGQRYEVVGVAITASRLTYELEFGTSPGSFDVHFDIQDLLLLTTYIHCLGKATGQERDDLLKTMFSARLTREPDSSYAVWRPNSEE